jgi:MFS family permease
MRGKSKEASAATPAPSLDGAASWYTVGVLMFAYMVAFIDRQIITLLIEPIKQTFDVNDTQVSLLSGFAFALFYTVLGLPIARLADRTNRKRLIAVGAFLWSLMTAAAGLASTFWILLLTRIGVGIGEATITPAALSMIADSFSRKRVARAVSVYAVGLYIGAGLAVLAGSVIIRLSSGIETFDLPLVGATKPWQMTFFVVGALGVPLLLLLQTLKEPQRQNLVSEENGTPVPDAQIPYSEVMKFVGHHKRLLCAHFLGFGICFGLVITAYMTWVPELLRRNYSLDIADAGTIFGIILIFFGSAGPISASYLTSWLRDRGYEDAEMRVSVWAGFFMIPFVILAPLVGNLYLTIALLCGAIFFLSVPQGMAPAILQIVAPNRMRAQLTALFMLVGVLAAYTLGPSLVAVLTDYYFRDDASLKYSLALVCGVITPLGVLSLSLGLKHYRAALQSSDQ